MPENGLQATLPGAGREAYGPRPLDEFVFRRIIAKAGLPGFHFHDLRHFFASMLIAQGKSAEYVCDQMGHSSIQVRDFWRKRENALQIDMSPKHLPPSNSSRAGAPALAFFAEELPLTVREAAVYLGVSVQTVYLWVERNQIPHLRVMGRNIRFLKSDLAPFRAQFRREVGSGKA